jgi:GT2 family glycosyltransferase
MRIAVIIATRGRPHDTEACLRSIEAQTEPPARIIVVDQTTPAYDLRAFPEVLHIHNTALSGLTAARNVGLDTIVLADTDVVFFADDDIEMDPRALECVRLAFEANPDAIGVQCLDAIAHEEGRLTAFLRKGRIEVPVLEGFGMSFRATLFATERFDERLRGYSFGEDWEFSHRARRYGVLLVAEGGIVHHHRSPLNRHNIQAHLRDRWTHYAYFYRKLDAAKDPQERALRAWWTIGETYKWLRHGMGLPRGTALDRLPTDVAVKATSNNT